LKSRALVFGNDLYELKHFTDTTLCYTDVKEASEVYWKGRRKTEAYDNYRFDKDAVPWSLGPMLAENKFDGGFTVMYKNGNVFSVGGIRYYSDEVALIMNRHFSFFTLSPVSHATIIPFQLEVCKELCFDQAWITVNRYNTWHNTWYKNEASQRRTARNKNSELYRQAKKCSDQCVNLGYDNINNTQQEILRWKL
jgi:hypothetical protein